MQLTQKGVHVKLRTNELSSASDFSRSVTKLVSQNQVSDPIPLNFIIFDEKEMVIILQGRDSRELSGIYTNNPALIHTFKYLYDRMT